MSKELLNILSDSNKEIDNQLLMDYVAGKLNAGQRHEVERLMAENEFVSDAVEGLEQVQNPKSIDLMVEQLNRDLHRKLASRKPARKKRRFKDAPWPYIAIILILTLAALAYFVIHKLQGK